MREYDETRATAADAKKHHKGAKEFYKNMMAAYEVKAEEPEADEGRSEKKKPHHKKRGAPKRERRRGEGCLLYTSPSPRD